MLENIKTIKNMDMEPFLMQTEPNMRGNGMKASNMDKASLRQKTVVKKPDFGFLANFKELLKLLIHLDQLGEVNSQILITCCPITRLCNQRK